MNHEDKELKTLLQSYFHEPPLPRQDEKSQLLLIIMKQKARYRILSFAVSFIIIAVSLSYFFLFHPFFSTKQDHDVLIAEVMMYNSLSGFEEDECYKTVTILENEWLMLTEATKAESAQ